MTSASLGFIGATLGNCGEYTGDYGCAVTPARMREFHKERLGMLADCLHGSAALHDQIGILAIETIPSAAEASAVADALEALHGRSTRLPPACISLTSSTADRIGCGDTIEDAVKAISNCPRVCAIGINCVPLGVVGGLLAGIRRATQKPIVCYPNSQPWSDANGGWHADDNLLLAAHFACEAAEWVRCAASIVGGCCRTTAENTRALVEQMLELRHE
ncbi:Catalyzes methyl transfer from S-methylmethionine (SMM) to adenosyl-L-homocysteine (AdoMet) [Kickxella alabastrina]|uniref:Catalyzes methyl transfer from S-methylmethionine (SMM) to adenosyl-L-homocysteine (AdoMet) n=1 Tax=Kickxella alabastrina TaxID=61397 RepID=A0ACC1II42_9FUNG|nr:Catalyzes methyl transfer from S-methylmethionine (SMM) to adenosyl-L-homocysteine (AdoMet) [Kickxella alabastrina]